VCKRGLEGSRGVETKLARRGGGEGRKVHRKDHRTKRWDGVWGLFLGRKSGERRGIPGVQDGTRWSLKSRTGGDLARIL